MKKLILVGLVIIPAIAFAVGKHEHKEHRSHKAHQHGFGTLGIAFEGLSGKLDFKIPAESIVGFEHEARNEKQKKAIEDNLKKFESNISQMVKFDNKLNCALSKEKLVLATEHEESTDKKPKKGSHGEHSEVEAEYNVKCDKPIAGTNIEFNFHQFFKKIKTIEVTVIADTTQKSLKVKKAGTILSM